MNKSINISEDRAAGILCGHNRKEIWLEIMEARQPGFCASRGYELPTFKETAQIRWGRAFESAIIELAERKINNRIFNRELLYNRNLGRRKSIITCHIDGQYDLQTLHEGKTTSEFYFRDNFGEPGTDEIPIEYQLQCQHELICTGAEKIILSVLVFPKIVYEWEKIGWRIDIDHVFSREFDLIHKENQEIVSNRLWARTLEQMGFFYQYEIKPNKELQDLMLSKYAEFWNNNVLKEIEPINKFENYYNIIKKIRELNEI